MGVQYSIYCIAITILLLNFPPLMIQLTVVHKSQDTPYNDFKLGEVSSLKD